MFSFQSYKYIRVDNKAEDIFKLSDIYFTMEVKYV